MLFSVSSITGFKLNSLDGALGGVKELLLDERHWTVRYLVAKTGTWLTSRQVLISPRAHLRLDNQAPLVNVDLTLQQIQDCPALRSDQPLTRQFEEEYHAFFGWPLHGNSPAPHLRSTGVLQGYGIQAVDGLCGSLTDFIVDDSTWSVRYLVIATKAWDGGNRVLISPQWVDSARSETSMIDVHLSGEALRHGPEYSEDALFRGEYNNGLQKPAFAFNPPAGESVGRRFAGCSPLPS